jgi:hypothetical protein
MNPGDSRLRLYLAFLLLAALALFGFGRRDSGPPRGAHPASAATTNFPTLVGSWVGTWQDTVYHVGGTMSFTMAQVGSSWTGNGMIDLTSVGLGQQSGTLTGAEVGSTLAFTFQAASVGTGSGSLTGGSSSGSGSVTAPLNFGGFTFAGSLVAAHITGTFHFTSPTGGSGKASFSNTTAVQSATWGQVRKRYR